MRQTHLHKGRFDRDVVVAFLSNGFEDVAHGPGDDAHGGILFETFETLITTIHNIHMHKFEKINS